MTAEPVATPGDTLRARYLALTRAGALEDDPAQRALLDRLDALLAALAADNSRSRTLGRLLRRKSPGLMPQGLFVFGPVGRGKTMLMDLFFEAAPVARKRRAHFHEFMADVHERVHAFRESAKTNGANGGDPIAPVADELAREEKLLCFDEFAVNDIADAMILGRLFTRLFEAGVVLVATSNTPPDDLYAGGINRQLFLPFIELLKQHVDVVRLDARTDFRLEKLASAPVYVTPLGPDADGAIDAAWRRLTGTERGPATTLRVLGRDLAVPQASKGVARFTFDELCGRALGTADYTKLAHDFHTLLIDRIPVMDETTRNEAKRFINLIDILYDHRVKLVASAAAEPEGLFVGTQGFEAQEFKRTASRLAEMRSAEYMGAAHGMADAPRS
jgi:cell division protein ZapE